MKSHIITDRVFSLASKINKNITLNELLHAALESGEGKITSTGALAGDTGKFTGRSPKDKFTVLDDTTKNRVWWGDINQPFDSEKFDALLERVINHYQDKEIFVRDAYACADTDYRLKVRVVTETAYQNLFVHHMFIRPDENELHTISPDWVILAAPSYMAVPDRDGTRQENFSIINFTKKIYIIGGSGYTGEIKKGIFSVLNFTLPVEHDVLSMHCSANIGKGGDSAVFFGLSGTGKTTLSADPDRKLIGDDEHGWSENGIFNFEGGCYAKTINLTQENEPTIWNAIREGALVENVRFFPDSDVVNYNDVSVTQNTRCAYPIDYIDNISVPSVGPQPKNIFFLTADAFGVLPPIAKLTPGQAGYHFISGYTAKVAGTEEGVNEPQATFSACFGAAFIPLHPGKYAEMLAAKMTENNVNVWLVNTGWSGGAYGTGSRMKLKYTRAMLNAALDGKLDDVSYENHPVFGVAMPQEVPGVPTELLNPRNTWADAAAYDTKANYLASLFNKNFEDFAEGVSQDILDAAPKASASL
ncbi:MAG: phosphoenolpyruvate carboxykinase (ATP) [Bacteroidetes bacterium]|nr:phosphoenolpyruvate carboxykinase (ATP) [Bacteroidota bacterium]